MWLAANSKHKVVDNRIYRKRKLGAFDIVSLNMLTIVSPCSSTAKLLEGAPSCRSRQCSGLTISNFWREGAFTVHPTNPILTLHLAAKQTHLDNAAQGQKTQGN
jgi:hypothetical protein